ncbi:GAF domain-containing protein [Arthrobacter sp. B0490]|uniref:GAF domain-containing protein n=1 Tax=Arthrobacter sp. B0490 TaxID=2058891 RepID=UPI0011AFDF9E|nr:GAF domain-containing protein [Arthrobacter sp. B0490]
MRGRPQRALMIQAMATVALDVDDITDRYRARGGTASPGAIGEYLDGSADLPLRESDLLADVVNTLCPASSTLPVPHAAQDAADGSSETSRRALGAAGAFLLSDGEKEQARLDAIDRTNLLDTEPEERFDRITRNAQRRFQVSTAIITLIDDKRQFLKSVIGPVEQNMPRARSFCNTTIRRSDPLIIRDTFHDEQFKWSPLVLGEPFIRFYAGCPLRDPDGWIVGTLCVIDQRSRAFSQADERSLRRLATITEHELTA